MGKITETVVGVYMATVYVAEKKKMVFDICDSSCFLFY